MNVFEVGKVYTAPGLYGLDYDVKVISRTRLFVEVEEVEHPREVTRMLIKIVNGNEVIKMWEYQREIGYIFPKPLY